MHTHTPSQEEEEGMPLDTDHLVARRWVHWDRGCHRSVWEHRRSKVDRRQEAMEGSDPR